MILLEGVGAAGGGAGTSFALTYQPESGVEVEIYTITFCNKNTTTVRAVSGGVSLDGGTTFRSFLYQVDLAAKEPLFLSGTPLFVLDANGILGLDPGEDVEVIVTGKKI